MTIEPEDPEAEGAEKKVRTKAITLLGARKGSGGKATYPNGDAFDGAYFAGKRHGSSGSYTYAAQPPPAEGEDPLPADGKYEGTWKKGDKSGLGVMVYAKGGKYHGMWKDGKRDGHSAARSKCPPWQCPSPPPAAPRVAPGGSGQLGTPRVRPSCWTPSHRLGGPSELPPKSLISLRLTVRPSRSSSTAC